MEKLRVLVTGASGFIGRNIHEALQGCDDIDVVGLTNSRVLSGTRRVDLTDRQQVAAAVRGMDVIVHAAAKSSGSSDIINHPEMHVAGNIIINTLLFEAAHNAGVGHVIFLSSGVVYPQRTAAHVFAEGDVDLRDGFFPNYFGVGWMKICAEKLAEFYSRLGRTRYTVVRPSNVYGPHDKFDLEHSHVFGATVAKVMAARDGEDLSVWGDGSPERDLLYVSDLCAFISSVIDHVRQGSLPPHDVVNVAAGTAVSIGELVMRIIKASEKTLGVTYDRSKPTIPTKVCFDITKAREIYGWSPRVTLDQGIEQTLAWYKQVCPEES